MTVRWSVPRPGDHRRRQGGGRAGVSQGQAGALARCTPSLSFVLRSPADGLCLLVACLRVLCGFWWVQESVESRYKLVVHARHAVIAAAGSLHTPALLLR